MEDEELELFDQLLHSVLETKSRGNILYPVLGWLHMAEPLKSLESENYGEFGSLFWSASNEGKREMFSSLEI